MRQRVVASAAIAAAVVGLSTVSIMAYAGTGPQHDADANVNMATTPGQIGETEYVSFATVDRSRVSSSRGGGECMTITIKRSEAGEGTQGDSCAPAGTLGRDGFSATYQNGDGPVLVYGVLPDAATSVRIPGATVERGGRAFSAIVSPAVDVHIEYAGGAKYTKSVDIGPAIPQSKYPVPAN